MVLMHLQNPPSFIASFTLPGFSPNQSCHPNGKPQQAGCPGFDLPTLYLANKAGCDREV